MKALLAIVVACSLFAGAAGSSDAAWGDNWECRWRWNGYTYVYYCHG